MNIYSDRIGQLRKKMKQAGMDIYYIPMSDCHASEYVSDYFRCIEYMTGFTGSAGHVIVSLEDAWLFADGRYYIQAAQQLEGSQIKLMKWGQPGVPEPASFAAEQAKGKVLGFDGAVVSTALAEKMAKDAADIKFDCDLVGEIWTDRPAQVFTEVWNYPEQYAGETSASKIERVRKALEEKTGVTGPYLYLLSSLDDIAWLFNIRANDIPNTPVAYAYAYLTQDDAGLLTHQKGYHRNWYHKIECVKATVLMDVKRINYATYRFFKDLNMRIVKVDDPSAQLKAVKNETEIQGLKNAIIRDSAVIIRLMHWVKENAGKIHMDEVSIDEFLQEERKKDPLYIEPSFDTIAAYRENAAMMHYGASSATAKQIDAEGMLLVDCGAQYMDGTTDTTRTFILGPVSEEEKKSFTLTAVAMLRMTQAKFIAGCRGENLDILARQVMWENGLDYKCGTGHGVGHVLSVHEGPHNIRWRIGDAGASAELKPGMIVTDEPGVYKEARYGIRTENELLVVPYMETEDGTFLQFENLTFVPIDKDGIDVRFMTAEDVEIFNAYHKMVYDIMAPFFDENLKAWLQAYTAPL